jgi:hypothetical protein
MRYLHGSIALLVFAAVAGAQEKADERATVLANFKTAMEAGDLKKLGPLVAGGEGEILRALAEPYAKAKVASDRFDSALKEKAIAFSNPFAGAVTPLADLQFDVVEFAREDGKELVRVRFGPRGKGQEETLLLQQEQGTWRVSLPTELIKELKPLTKREERDRRAKGIEKLSELLDTAAREVQNGTLKTKEAVALRMARLFEEGNLAELFK